VKRHFIPIHFANALLPPQIASPSANPGGKSPRSHFKHRRKRERGASLVFLPFRLSSPLILGGNPPDPILNAGSYLALPTPWQTDIFLVIERLSPPCDGFTNYHLQLERRQQNNINTQRERRGGGVSTNCVTGVTSFSPYPANTPN
jgi:hypothetical protein